MCARLIAAFKELLKIAAVPVGGVDRGVGRDDRERTQRDPAFLGDEFEQTAEADQIAEQFFDIVVIAVERGHAEATIVALADQLETGKAQALTAVGRVIHVAGGVEDQQFEFVERSDVRVAQALDDAPDLIDWLAGLDFAYFA